MDQLITSDSEIINSLLKRMDDLQSNIECLSKNYKPSLKNDRFYTAKEVCAMFKMSERALKTYRENRIIPFIKIGGKILFRESDLEKLLHQNLKPALRDILF